MNSRNIQLKYKFDFDNLKSNYFLRKVFNMIKKNKLLKILKYNKQLQKRLNLDIKDYINYTQIYTSIEIELKLVDNINKNDKFINILANEEEYFHIYFNNSKEELKRNYLEENDNKIKIIKIIIDYQVKSFKELFKDCECISSIFFKNFYRTNIEEYELYV